MHQLISKRKGNDGKFRTFVINVPDYNDNIVGSSSGEEDDDTGGGDGGGGGGGGTGIWTIGTSAIDGSDVLT